MTTNSIREQILADQAQRAEGENHTESTVRNAACALGAIATRYRRVAVAEQRRIFGGAVFGKREWKHDYQRGGFWVYRRVDYGRDYHHAFFTYAEIAKLLNKGETVKGQKD
jgi:hypothetical protein